MVFETFQQFTDISEIRDPTKDTRSWSMQASSWILTFFDNKDLSMENPVDEHRGKSNTR
jgi:hypothetical protein